MLPITSETTIPSHPDPPCYEQKEQTGYERKTSELGTERTDPGGSGVWSNGSNGDEFDHVRPKVNLNLKWSNRSNESPFDHDRPSESE